MSLSWRDLHIAVVAPQRVALIRRRRGWGRHRHFDLKLDAPWVGAPTAAADALGELLQRPEIGAGELRIVISSHFVRYVLIPWRDEITTREEFATYAQICCDQTYGSTGAARSLRTAPEKEGSPRLAATLDTVLLEALTRAASSSRLHLTSVQPYLSAAYNRLAGTLPRDDFILVIAEPGRSCLLAASHGRWTCVRTSSGEDQALPLAELIEREAQLLGLCDAGLPPLFVHAPRQTGLKLRECHGVTPDTLDLAVPGSLAEAADPLLTMAMTVT